MNLMKNQNNYIAIIFLLFVGTLLANVICDHAAGEQPHPSYEKITITGETARNGVFDPSVEYDKDGTTGWMAYSAVEEPGQVHTHIAKTTDNGKTWKFVFNVNPSKHDAITYKGKNIEGIWRNEVPTLVYDPDDADKEWKLLWHKYFVKPPFRGKDRMFLYGWIAYRYARDPKGPWSDETALFGAGTFLPAPYKVEHNLNAIHPDQKHAAAYTEPGTLYKNGILYLALQVHIVKKRFLRKPGNISKIILISSEDHGETWQYRGVLVDEDDAQHFGYLRLVAPSLVEEKDRTFIFLSPFRPLPVDHDGTYIFEFEAISKSRLKRDKRNRLIVHKYLPPSIEGDNINAGESDYDEHNSGGGIIMPQIDVNKGIDKKSLTVLDFQMYNTNEGIIKEITGGQ